MFTARIFMLKHLQQQQQQQQQKQKTPLLEKTKNIIQSYFKIKILF